MKRTLKATKSRQLSQASMNLFAFGTLKRGFPLHEEGGLGGARFLGTGRTTERFPMVIAGPWFAPMMLHRPGEGHRVWGELYKIDEERLATLDVLESIGKPGNLRLEIAIDHATGRSTAYAYFKASELAVPLHSGYLERYEDRRFIPSFAR
jgi:gamma-glutamylaminecyclotransferase